MNSNFHKISIESSELLRSCTLVGVVIRWLHNSKNQVEPSAVPFRLLWRNQSVSFFTQKITRKMSSNFLLHWPSVFGAQYHIIWLPIHSLFTVKDWLSLIPPTALTAGFVYVSYLAFCPIAQCPGRARPNKRVNNKIRLNEQKVVDMIDVEDIAEKAAFCRCWKSKNWPYWWAQISWLNT